MFSLRQASDPFRKQGPVVRSWRVLSSRVELHTCSCSTIFTEHGGEMHSDRSFSLRKFFNISIPSGKLLLGTRSFTSKVDTRSSGEEDNDLEHGFSEHENSTVSDKVPASSAIDDSDDELISGPDLSEDDDDDVDAPEDVLDISDAEVDVAKMSQGKRQPSVLLTSILAAPASSSVVKIVENWVQEGNEVTRPEAALVIHGLRKRRMYAKALQLSEWLEVSKVEFVDRDYASRVDLIAKVLGLQKAENYIDKLPESRRNEVVFRTLLANYASLGNVKKSEEVFNKMKELGFSITCFAYNQLLLLYKKCDRKKLADVLLLMEQENVKPFAFTYKILIDVKGQFNDIAGMEKVVETMKSDGMEPDLYTKSLTAKHYISAGLTEKAEDLLKEMEAVDMKEKRWVCEALFPLYAALGKADDVGRLWSLCESNPRLLECVAAIGAWGKLHKIDKAEAVFDTMSKRFRKLSSRMSTVMLRVYADHKLLSKGKDLLKRMSDSGCPITPFTWDALVKLYIGAGEVEKADTVLQRVAKQARFRPFFTSYMAIMDQYAKRGDIHNTEKVFHRMKLAGYVSQTNSFRTLVQAYINCKAPAYGISERMKAENVIPSGRLAAELAMVDPFRKTSASILLD